MGDTPNGARDTKATTSAPPAAPTMLSGRKADSLSLVLMLGFLMASLALSIVPVIAERLKTDLELSASSVGLLSSAFLLAYGLVQIPAGMAASRKAGPVLAGAFGLMALGAILLALVQSFPALLAARVLQGAGAGIVLPASGAVMAARISGDRLGRAWGFFGAGWGIGALVALLALPAIAQSTGLTGVGIAVAVVTVVVAFVAARWGAFGRILSTGPPPPLRDEGRRLASVARTPGINLLGLINAMALAVGVGALTWTPSFLTDEHGAATTMAAYLVAGLGAAQVVATPVGASVAGRIGPTRTISIAFVGLAALPFLVPFLPSTWLVAVIVIAVGFFSMMYFPPTFAQVPRFASQDRVGLANGYVNALGFLGSLVVPWLFGVMLDAGYGYTAGFLLLAACGLVGLLTVPVLSRARARLSKNPQEVPPDVG